MDLAEGVDSENERALQRLHDLREVFNALRCLVRTGSPWRYLPNDLPRWAAVYQQTQRWLPTTECAMIPGTSHGMHAGNPQDYNDTVVAFLARHRKEATWAS